jgi:hypothetical protein
MMPYYAMQMWMKTPDNGVAATLFGPSSISTLASKENTPVVITQSTRYPFEESIEFEINTDEAAEFEFLLRIPGWSTVPEVELNGEKLKKEPEPGTFYSIKRKFADGDIIRLSVPMAIKLAGWPNRGISIERGPVVYSFNIPDSTVIAGDFSKSTPEFPAYDIYPAGTWQYSPVIIKNEDIQVVLNEDYSYPWDPGNPPVKLRVPARKVLNWDLKPVETDYGRNFNITGFPELPDLSDETETISLVPYGSTLLRVTVFPRAE